MKRAVVPILLALGLAGASCGRSHDVEPKGALPSAAPAPAPAPANPRRPVPAVQGVDETGALRVGIDDRCPVCAMSVDEHRKFASAVALRDGRTYYFCGTGCMIRAWLHPEAFLDASRDDLAGAWTKDWFTGEPLDALQATFVAGSDVTGPMGAALVPLGSDPDVETFRQRHGGTATFRLADLDDARFEAVTGRRAVPGAGNP
jgi:copper chaperone NosL